MKHQYDNKAQPEEKAWIDAKCGCERSPDCKGTPCPECQPQETSWTEWHGGECPLKDEEVLKLELKYRDGVIVTDCINPSKFVWTHNSSIGDVIAYRVTKWREGCGPVDWKAKYEKEHKTLEQVLETVGNIHTRAKKAEAELYSLQTLHNDRDTIERENSEKMSAIENQLDLLLARPQLSTLRPISEAGPVPAGCVRVYSQYSALSGHLLHWFEREEGTTHFADIRVPEEAPKEEEKPDPYAELKAAHAAGKVIQHLQDGIWWNFTDPRGPAYSDVPDQYRIKPAPETFKAHGKFWTRHTPGDPMPKAINIEAIDRSGCMYATKLDIEHEIFWTVAEYSNPFIGWRYADEPTPKKPVKPWTPAVGDVVTLKSGGPKMTVSAVGRVEVQVHGFKGESLVRSMLPIATLIPAQP